MDEILQNTPGTISNSWYQAGVLVDPGTVTIGVETSDGTTVVAAGTATSGSGAAARTFNLTDAHAANLDLLTATWVSTTKGTMRTRISVVGGFYFSTAEFKDAHPNDAEVQALTSSQIQKARQTAEEIIEKACNVAFVPRAKRLTLSGDGRTRLGIPLYKVRRVSAYSIADVVGDTSLVTLEGSSAYRSIWTRGFSNVALTVEHGYDEPPAEIRDAAMTLTYHRAVKGPIDDRAIGIPTDGGIVTLATPGVRGAVTGLPGVDQAIQQYRLPPIVPMSVPLYDRGNAYPPLPVF